MASSRSIPTVRARFGRFEFDLNSRELSCSGARVSIQDKPLQMLRLLLEADGQVVTREQIRSALWPDDTFVDFEHGVNTAVKKLRQALKDSAESPQYVETLPRVGYRLLVPVEWLEDSAGTKRNAHLVSMPSPASEPVRAPLAEREPRDSKRRRVVAVAALGMALVAIAVWFLTSHGYFSSRSSFHVTGSSKSDNGPSPIQRRRLTANPEDAPVTSAAISPDGKYLAYTDSTGFYLKLVETGETRPLPLPAAFTPAVESWFPDSVHLVVSWIEDTRKPPGLWITSVLGGTPRKLTDVGSFARVSPDGSQIAFLRGPWDDNEIWLVDSNGNSARKMTDGGADGFGPVSWSPDGTRFVSVRVSVERPEGQIQLYDAISGRAETIMTLSGLGQDVVWSRASVLYYSLAESPPNQDSSNLWSVRLDRRTGRLAGSATRVTDDRERIGSITATNDGRLLAALRYSFQTDVFLTTIEPVHKKLSPPQRFTLDQRNDFPSSWTPDSRAVLIVSNRDGVNHVFKQKIDETQPELFIGGKQDVWLPHMSPDGTEILYLISSEQVGPTDTVQLMSIPISGGPSRLVLEERGLVNYQCARLPSKTCVYGKLEREDYRFFSFDCSNGNRRELPIRMKKGSAINNWNLSPDGRYLAISETQNPYEGPRLRVISLADNSERLLSPSKLNLIFGVDWAANSKSIWLGGYIGRGWSARSGLINVDLNGQQTVAIEVRSLGILGGTPSPDGHRLALGTNSFSSNVWLLENP